MIRRVASSSTVALRKEEHAVTLVRWLSGPAFRNAPGDRVGRLARPFASLFVLLGPDPHLVHLVRHVDLSGAATRAGAALEGIVGVWRYMVSS